MAAFQFNHASSVQHGEKVQQYCDYINTLIESPKTERELHQRAIDAQEEYNQALFAERDSWRATADRSELTVSITKRHMFLKPPHLNILLCKSLLIEYCFYINHQFSGS
jgi:hypothetical protein